MHTHPTPRQPDAAGSSIARGAVLILNAGQGAAPEIARQLAREDVALVLHSSGASGTTGDLLQEIVEAGGRAAAVECRADNSRLTDEVLAATSAVVGPVTTVVVCPWLGEGRPSASPIGLEPRVIAAVENACRWVRAVVEALPHPAEATVVALWRAQATESVRESVPDALWRGLLRGLRRELAPRGVRVSSLTVATAGDPSRAKLEPRAAAARISELTRTSSAVRSASGHRICEHGREPAGCAAPPAAPTVARWV